MELRKDPLKNIWTVMTPERNGRIGDFILPGTRSIQNVDICPFCPGNDHAISHILLNIEDKGNWLLRVFPNRYPALKVENELKLSSNGLYDVISGTGAHEVIVYSRDHTLDMKDHTEDLFFRLFSSVVLRINDLEKDTRIAYMHFFQNCGYNAGASLSHPHCQLLGMPVIPPTLRSELLSSADHFEKHRRCLCCDIVEKEWSTGKGLVAKNNNFVAFVPYASQRPFETVIYPLFHSSSFESISTAMLREFSSIVTECFKKIGRVLDEPDYNMVLYNSPTKSELSSMPLKYANVRDYYHWHLEITPVIKTTGGVEKAGVFFNSVLPEEAALLLR